MTSMPSSRARSKSSTASFDLIVGGRVRARRLEVGMSQEALAEALGLTFQQVQKYEKGVNRISVGRLSQIADALKTDTNFFMKDLSASNGKGKPSPREMFMATREGAAIIDVMLGLDLELQRTVIDVARRLASANGALNDGSVGC
jgi:transcriptional regulator with XRE-family HTH domain